MMTTAIPPLASCLDPHVEVFKNRLGRGCVLGGGRAAQISADPTGGLPRLPHWQLVRYLGKGSWSHVYQARPSSTSEEQSAGHADYVVKLVPDQHPQWQQAVASLRREALVARRLWHPHVVSVLATHFSAFPYYTVTPYLRGVTLRELLQRRCLSTALSLSIARQTAEALAALHRSGWLHADVKPENMLVSPRGHVTLIDLGLARRLGSDECSGSAPVVGTLAYMAPEVGAEIGRPGAALTTACDLFSLGRVLDEMLSGTVAKRRPTVDRTAEPESSPAIRPSWNHAAQRRQLHDAPTTRSILELVSLLLDRRPQCRPSASELVRCLGQLERVWSERRTAA